MLLVECWGIAKLSEREALECGGCGDGNCWVQGWRGRKYIGTSSAGSQCFVGPG